MKPATRTHETIQGCSGIFGHTLEVLPPRENESATWKHRGMKKREQRERGKR